MSCGESFEGVSLDVIWIPNIISFNNLEDMSKWKNKINILFRFLEFFWVLQYWLFPVIIFYLDDFLYSLNGFIERLQDEPLIWKMMALLLPYCDDIYTPLGNNEDLIPHSTIFLFGGGHITPSHLRRWQGSIFVS